MIWRVFRLFCLFVIVNILPLNAYAQDAAALPEPTQATPLIPDEFLNLFDQLKCDYEEFARKQAVTAIYNLWVNDHTSVDCIDRYISENKLDDCQLFAFAELLFNTWTKYHPRLLRAYLPYVKNAAVSKSSDDKETYVARRCDMIAGRAKWFELFLAAMSSREGLAAASEIILNPDTDSVIRFVLFTSVFNCSFPPAKEYVVQLPSFGRKIRLIPLSDRPEAVALLKQLILNPTDLRDEVFQTANNRQDIIDDHALAVTVKPGQFEKDANCAELQAYVMHGGKETLAAIDVPNSDQLQTADISVGNHVLVGFNIALNIGEKPAQPWIDIAKAIVLSAFKSQTLSPEQLTEGKKLIADFPTGWGASTDSIKGYLKTIEAQLEKGAIEDVKRSALELKTYIRTYESADTLANAAIDKLVTFIDSVVSNQGRVAIKTSVPKCDSNELRIKDNVFRSDILLLALQVLGLAQDPEGMAICRSLADKKVEANYKLAAVLCLLWNGADETDKARVDFFVNHYKQYWDDGSVWADPVNGYTNFLENARSIQNPKSANAIWVLLLKAVVDSPSACAGMSASVADANRQKRLQGLILQAQGLSTARKSSLIFVNQAEYGNRRSIYCCSWTIKSWMNYCLQNIHDTSTIQTCLNALWVVSPRITQSEITCREAATLLSANLDWLTVQKILEENKFQVAAPTTAGMAASILKPQKSKNRKKYLLKLLGSVPKGSSLDTEIRAMLKEK